MGHRVVLHRGSPIKSVHKIVANIAIHLQLTVFHKRFMVVHVVTQTAHGRRSFDTFHQSAIVYPINLTRESSAGSGFFSNVSILNSS